MECLVLSKFFYCFHEWIENIFVYGYKKIYCFECKKYRKIVDRKTSYIFDKTLVLPIICSKSGNNNDRIFREEENIEILKILGLIGNINE